MSFLTGPGPRRQRRCPIEVGASEPFYSRGTLTREDEPGGKRIRRDIERAFRAGLDRAQSLARAVTAMAIRRERKVAKLVLPSPPQVIGVAPVADERAKPVAEASPAELREARQEQGAHQRGIRDRPRRHCFFDRQPAVPAVTGRVKPETCKEAPERAVPASLDAASVNLHRRRRPPRVTCLLLHLCPVLI